MKLLKSKGLLLTLVLTLALPVMAFAQTDEGNTTTAHEKRTKITDHVKKKFHHKKDHLMFGVHKQMYMQLLSEKYTPEQTGEWDEAFTEREQLMEQMKELKTIKKEEMKNAFKEEMEKLREKVENGELTKQEAKHIVKEQLKEKYQEKKQNHEKYHEQNRELMKQFNEAIAAEDAEQIKSTLPQLLEVFKAQNERLKEVIASISN
jgi:polyhydroxyalkanoate synthesis regulator phasin